MKRNPTDQRVAPGKRPCRHSVNTGLMVSPVTFGEDIVRGLIHDWIVPDLVEQFLRSKGVLPDPAGKGHN